MNRIERRVAGAGGPRPGAAVCEPGQPANNQRRGMLGGGLLSTRMNSRNSTIFQVAEMLVERIDYTLTS